MRVRTKELRYVRAADIDPHPLNWRTHPAAQRSALRGVIEDIGFAGAVEAVEVDGRLRLVDGHLRREELIDVDAEIPVLVLDLDEREVAEYLVTKDPLAAMAGSSAERLDALLRDVSTGSAAVQDLLASVSEGAGLMVVDPIEEFPELPKGDRSTIRQMTFTVTAAQQGVIEAALAAAKDMGAFGDTGNENSNGNALARVCEAYG